MSLSYEAMIFAREKHRTQRRKYIDTPYTDHLAAVAGMVASVGDVTGEVTIEEMVATAWLHDCVEDQGVTRDELLRFGETVTLGVFALSDTETGNRATRKALARARLGASPAWVQTIKCADLIDNTSSIVQHDAKFSPVFLAEKRALLDALTRADVRLLAIARELAGEAEAGE